MQLDVNKAAHFRNLFFGRQDVYGRKWISKDGDFGGYAPVCTNFWTDVCHIKLKDGITCARCEVKQYSPVTDESVWKHISGEEAQIQYLLLQDGTIKFAAFDLDCKPSKEEVGYTFEDTLKLSKALTARGIPNYMARSTTLGHHVYVFFEDFYPANKWRAIALDVCEEVGFMELMRAQGRPLPEVFPKASGSSGLSLGNGVKPPFIEPNFAKQRNGFITDDNVFIQDQWGYGAAFKRASTAVLDQHIIDAGIEVREEQVTHGSQAAHCSDSGVRGAYSARSKRWQQPISGSIEKVVEGCAAFRRVIEACKNGTPPNHQEGFAL